MVEVHRRMDWKTLLAYITGSVDQELLLRNEYLVTENRLLRTQIKGRIRLSDGKRKTLAEIGKKLGKQALKEVASSVTLDTILAWHRKLIAQKFNGSQQRKALPVAPRSTRSWRCWSSAWPRRIAPGAMIALKRHGIPPAPNARQSPRGRSSCTRTWMCSWQPTFSPPRCGRSTV